jgi:hypothetical protein
MTQYMTVSNTTHPSDRRKQANDWLAKVTPPKFQTLSSVTYVYGKDSKKCSSTITPQRISILQDVYNSACHQDLHTLLRPPVQDIATEIHGLLHQLSVTGKNTKAECPHPMPNK